MKYVAHLKVVYYVYTLTKGTWPFTAKYENLKEVETYLAIAG